MSIIPLLRCSDMKASLAFYTTILDFEWKGTWPEDDPMCFSVLEREGSPLHLCTFDGSTGKIVLQVMVSDIDSLYKKFKERGLITPTDGRSPVHEAPIDQTWGWREFYVNDPDGHTLRFGQRIEDIS